MDPPDFDVVPDPMDPGFQRRIHADPDPHHCFFPSQKDVVMIISYLVFFAPVS